MHIIPEHQQRPIGDEGHRECVGIFAEHELYHQIHILAVWFQGNMVGIGLPCATVIVLTICAWVASIQRQPASRSIILCLIFIRFYDCSK